VKRLGNVYDRICDWDNLLAAFAAVRKGHGRSREVAAFATDLDANLVALRRDLLAGDFRFGAYNLFKVYDPKERMIAAAPVRERVIHHAVMNVCGERLDKALTGHTYACRKGKGQWKAVAAARRHAARHPWCLKLDVRHYFDSIDHGVMLAMLGRLYKDRRLMDLFRALLASYRTGGESGARVPSPVGGSESDERSTLNAQRPTFNEGRGLPIGNLTSQYFANLYLAPVDRFISSKVLKCGSSKVERDADDFRTSEPSNFRTSYVRYMDDMLVFGGKAELLRLRGEIEALCRERLKLEIKHGGSLHRTGRGVDFLGCRVTPGVLRLSARSRKRFFKKSARYERFYAAGVYSELKFQRRLTALYAFVRHADTLGLRRQAFGEDGQREQPRASRRQLEQQRAELPVGVPQQQRPVERQQQHRPARACSPGSSAEQETATNRPSSRSRSDAGQRDPAPPGPVGGRPKATARAFFAGAGSGISAGSEKRTETLNAERRSRGKGVARGRFLRASELMLGAGAALLEHGVGGVAGLDWLQFSASSSGTALRKRSASASSEPDSRTRPGTSSLVATQTAASLSHSRLTTYSVFMAPIPGSAAVMAFSRYDFDGDHGIMNGVHHRLPNISCKSSSPSNGTVLLFRACSAEERIAFTLSRFRKYGSPLGLGLPPSASRGQTRTERRTVLPSGMRGRVSGTKTPPSNVAFSAFMNSLLFSATTLADSRIEVKRREQRARLRFVAPVSSAVRHWRRHRVHVPPADAGRDYGPRPVNECVQAGQLATPPFSFFKSKNFRRHGND
jgi:hypothetical protein